MSWIDDIEGIEMIITTGNGVGYTVQYFTSTIARGMDFNVSEFQFINKKGTLVKRGEPRGKRYDIQFMFVGDDCVTRSKKFAKDAEDRDAWTIIHPYYGGLVVQPISLTFDDTVLNVSKVTGTIVETNEEGISAPKLINVANSATSVNTSIAGGTVTAIPELSTSNITTLSTNNTTLYDTIKGKLNSLQENLDRFNVAYNNAMAFLNPLIYSVLDIATSTQSLLMAPAYFIASVNNRVLMFKDMLSMLDDMVEGILAMYNIPTKSSKALYELYGSTAIAGLCVSATTEVGEAYTYRPDVVAMIDTIVTEYNRYIANLDTLQSSYGGELDSYIPNADSIGALTRLVHSAITQLLIIANNAKQERVIFVTEPTNPIVLTWELYGMSLDDSTLDLFIKSNNIGKYELIDIPVGRRIIYYI
jgi:hypothetical protein